MQLPEICIRRPVLATVMSLMIVLVGAISLHAPVGARVPEHRPAGGLGAHRLQGREPTGDRESQITAAARRLALRHRGHHDDQIGVARGGEPDHRRPSSPARDVDAAANDVRDRVARVRALLPEARTIRWSPRSRPTRRRSCGSRCRATGTPLELSDYADRYIADPLKALPGVASVIIGGERKYAMRVWLDRERLAAYGLTPQDVEDALQAARTSRLPAGASRARSASSRCSREADLRTAEQFNNMIITEVNGYPVRLQGRRRARARARSTSARSCASTASRRLGLGVVKQSTANTLAVAQAVKAELPRLQPTLPEGMKLQVAVDTSLFIEARSRRCTGRWSRRCCWWCW